ncbi:MAG: hypothetical protein NVSMB49_16350 [Ktedonobacteraceae bacterium]
MQRGERLGMFSHEPTIFTLVTSFQTWNLLCKVHDIPMRTHSMSSRLEMEIYIVRAALEGTAAHVAATRLTEDDFARLAELLDNMLTTAAHADQRGFSEHNVAFDRVIVEASGNRTLINLWNTLQPLTWTLFSVTHSGHDLMELAVRHRVVIEAFRARDPHRAEQVMHNHLEEIGAWVRSQEEQDHRAALAEQPSQASSERR